MRPPISVLFEMGKFSSSSMKYFPAAFSRNFQTGQTNDPNRILTLNANDVTHQGRTLPLSPQLSAAPVFLENYRDHGTVFTLRAPGLPSVKMTQYLQGTDSGAAISAVRAHPPALRRRRNCRLELFPHGGGTASIDERG